MSNREKTYLLAVVDWLDNDGFLAGSPACEQDNNSAFFHTKE
jgi:hypothetical protein